MNLPRCCQHKHSQFRQYATKYTARVTAKTLDGCAFAAEVYPTTVPFDPKGYPMPRRDLICKIVQILKRPNPRTISGGPSSNPFSNLSHYLLNLTLQPLTTSEASLVLKSMNDSPLLCLEFFRFCPSSIPNFRHDCFTYNRILLILSRAALFGREEWVQKVLEMVEEMEKTGVKGSISTVNILIGVLGANGVERCLALVKKWGLRLNSYTFKCILQAYLRSYDTEKAYGIYVDMRRKGYKLDVVAYNMLLDALAKDKKVDKTYKVFEDMKKWQCEPDEFTYTIMIRMTGKIGKVNKSMNFFKEMLAKGFSPNLISYNTMIGALAKARLVDKVISLFSNMVENDCRPNEFTYSVILDVLVTDGKLGKLDQVVEISKKYMSRSIFAYLVKTLGKLGHANEAHRLFSNMWEVHDKGDRDACISMLECLCGAGKTSEAIDLLDKIHEKGVVADIKMYNTVLSSLGRLKQIPQLHDLYVKMKSGSGPKPEIFTYNILISNFGRAGKVDEAMKVFEELEDSDCVPDVISYNSLINCLGKNGDIDEAHMRFKEMQEKGLSPDVVTYSTLIECFGKTEKVEMACSLFDEMIADGCSPNIVTYNIMLDCLEKNRQTGKAMDFYMKLREQGLTPDSITYSVLERLQSSPNRIGRIRKQDPIKGWIVSPLK